MGIRWCPLKILATDPVKVLPSLLCGAASLFCLACWLVWIVPILGWLAAFPAGIVGFLGNGFAAIFIYNQAALTIQLDKFEAQNKNLGKAVDDMKANNDRLADELNGLNDFKEDLQRFADGQHEDMAGMMQRSKEMFSTIHNLTRDNNHTLLMRIAQDIEFIDRDEGISKKEFDRFLQRIPKQLQTTVTNMPSSFGDVDKDNDNMISFEEIQSFVENLLANADKDVDLAA